jgi:transposase InsO family protein
MVCEELSICHTTLIGWLDKYQRDGYSGLEPMRRCDTGQDKLAAAITEEILALKEQHPKFGVRRISQWLRRWHLLPASPETVRDRLRQAGLMKSPSRKARKRNLTRPRFFERATPNQMWQSDIFTFRLGGKYAYLIAFLDDYSRFITGADLFRSPTAHAVIEVYRVGTGEYQPPKEMLTDNGRQYTSWRGVSRFEAELRKDRVAHIKSRPHHPMTLGKIERFWSSIWGEFLARAQFESFEQARERIKLWLKYYNHKRPHQGIGGLCPADRFFEIQSELKKTLEAGIQDNLLELALRGQPRAPFYMVGRMDNQSVVLHAEKGKLKLSVSQPQNPDQELVYDLHPKDPQSQDPQASETTPQCDGQSPGGAGGVDRPVQTERGLPSGPGALDHVQSLATASDGGDAPSLGEPGQPEPGSSAEPSVKSPTPEAPAGHQHQPAQPALGESCLQASGDQDGLNECPSPSTSDPHPASPSRPDHGQRSRPSAGDVPQDLLPVGEAGPGRSDAGTQTGQSGPPFNPAFPASATPAPEGRRTRSEAGEDRKGGSAP